MGSRRLVRGVGGNTFHTILMAAMWRDLRFAVYTLRQNPATTAVAVATLALVIGANAAIFSLLNALVLRPLPIPHPEQLADLTTRIADNVNGEDT